MSACQRAQNPLMYPSSCAGFYQFHRRLPLYRIIEWTHIVQGLHVLLTIVSFVPCLQSMDTDIHTLFHTKYTINRMRILKTKAAPLGINSKLEIETEETKRVFHVFFSQPSSIDPEYVSIWLLHVLMMTKALYWLWNEKNGKF
jgi:hypothetical protein